MPRQVIGFCGLAGSGKTTAAKRLMEKHNFALVSLGQPLKYMLGALLEMCGGVPIDKCHRMLYGDLKEVPARELGGRTPRHAMQTLGTEWGRKFIAPSLWVDAWRDVAQRYSCVVVDDVRFPDEAAAITAMGVGGRLYVLHRPGLVAGSHESERNTLVVDGAVMNDGSVEDLHDKIDRLVRSGEA